VELALIVDIADQFDGFHSNVSLAISDNLDQSKRRPGTEALRSGRVSPELRRQLWILRPIKTANWSPPEPTPRDFP
jgi:hypothetical protein